jgi:hypothetical protein
MNFGTRTENVTEFRRMRLIREPAPREQKVACQLLYSWVKIYFVLEDITSGKRHREGGLLAMITISGYCEWWVNGQFEKSERFVFYGVTTG